jgi:oxygen-dependent protoporphyrinogen oxidase
MSNITAAPVAILGAGLAGLTAAQFLIRRGIPVVLYEAGKQVAGLAASFQENGFIYDIGAHFITNRLANAIGVLNQCRYVRYYGESVLLRGRYYGYPFGLILSQRFTGSALANRLPGRRRPESSESVAERFVAMYGKALAQEVAIPLVEAWSGVPASELAPSVADKIPISIPHVLLLKIAGYLRRRAIAIGYGREKPASFRVWHVYPDGGLSVLCQSLAAALTGTIHLESPAEAIVVDSGRVMALRINGTEQEVSAVISTIPCTMLPRLIQGSRALDYLSRFRFRPMLFVNMRFVGRDLLKDVVVWTPEPAFPFFRLTETPMSMPWLAPPGKTIITVDIGCKVGDAFWRMNDTELGEYCIENLGSIIPDAQERYLGCRIIRTPIAYPVFLKEYEEERKRFKESTGIEFLYSIGRSGEFDHLLTEDVYWRTLAKMETILPALAKRMSGGSTSKGRAIPAGD